MGPGTLAMTDCSNLPLRMGLVSITPEEDLIPALTLEEARMQLRITPTFGTSPPSHPEDPLIRGAVLAAMGELEGPTGWLGRTLTTREWRLTLPAFQAGRMVIPLPPLQGVSAITYLDKDGAEQTMDAGDYRAIPTMTAGYVELTHGKSWPSPGQARSDAVGVTFTAGYGDAEEVPALIKQYLKARLGFYYEHRESEVVGTIVTPLPGYRHILENFRVLGVLE
jgi:uncharacterized phiE125 gp8 family phage protein